MCESCYVMIVFRTITGRRTQTSMARALHVRVYPHPGETTTEYYVCIFLFAAALELDYSTTELVDVIK